MPDVGSQSYILRGGFVCDGSGDPGYIGDVRIADEKITHVARHIPAHGNTIIDMDGLIISPGLIDLHVHVYDGMNLHSVSPRDAGLPTGVTTMLDTGSAGAMNYATFEKYIIKPANETIYALLNVSHFGTQGHPEIPPYLGDLYQKEYLDPSPTLRCLDRHPEHLVGVKARLTASLAGGREHNERVALANTLHISRGLDLPAYIHHVASNVPIEEVLHKLCNGDVLTHIYHAHGDGCFQNKGIAPSPELLAARERGVICDVGHGSGCFSWDVAETACQEYEFWPDTISTDLHQFNVASPVVDLTTTMSKFMHLGMSVEKAIQCVTANPAAMLRRQHQIGRLLPGHSADITILQRVVGQHVLVDSMGAKRVALERLVPISVIKDGARFECNAHGAGSAFTPETAIQ